MYIITELYKNLKFYLWLCYENNIRESCPRINWIHFPLCFVYQLSFECLLSASHVEHEDLQLKFREHFYWRLAWRAFVHDWITLAFLHPPSKKKKASRHLLKLEGERSCHAYLWAGHIYNFSVPQKKSLFRASSWIILFLAILGLSSACMCISYWLYTCVLLCLYVYWIWMYNRLVITYANCVLKPELEEVYLSLSVSVKDIRNYV